MTIARMAFTPHKKLPWMIPVPVKTSDFTPLKQKHTKYNIEVDLAQIGAFADFKKPISDVAYADLQTNVDLGFHGRLGSGRAVFYKGAYLKGVGRTLLAGNWNHHFDVLHNSGHLSARSAICEYFVSCWLGALGLKHTIIPCEGVLLRPLPSGLRNYVIKNNLSPNKTSAVDLKFQGISIKPEKFIRYSNLFWSLYNPTPNYTNVIYKSIRENLGLSTESTPTLVAKKMVQSIECGFQNFLSYLNAGVYWNSLHNNFSMDGRFLDLETPIILGEPYCGYICGHSGRRFRTSFLEPLIYLRFACESIRIFAEQANAILDKKMWENPGDEFVEFAKAIKHEVRLGQSLLDKELQIKKLIEYLRSQFGLSRIESNYIKDIVDTAFEVQPSGKISLTPIKVDFKFDPKDRYSNRLYPIEELHGSQTFNLDRAQELNRRYIEIFKIDDMDSLLFTLEKLPRELAILATR
jgi:hypothetical protein